MAKHEICRQTLSGSLVDESTLPFLPTRVIQITEGDGIIRLHLLETHGQRGQYVALSHCWGNALHRPLMTTQSTLLDHIRDGIQWEMLPRTYQDAISATLRLGFKYIWIDSICIVQDLHSDWLRESKLMGDVYQHARLTIAASHAANSGEPCFFTRPPASPTVELPQKDGQSIFASLPPTDFKSISPEQGPLSDRAWATQEWLLSRRMIFYTTGDLVWSCKLISQFETGLSFHITARNPRWKIIIEKYSARSLTNHTDRLIALEGVRAALAAKRTDDTYCLGLWKNSMPDQLLWYVLEPAERSRSELNLPTWTWASTLHGVRFLDQHGARNTCEMFRFDEATRVLTIRAVLRGEVRLVEFDEEVPMVTQSVDLIREPKEAGLLRTLTCGGASIGWCVLDDNTLVDFPCVCLSLMQRTAKMRIESRKEKTHVEWILLLRPAQVGEDIYERIGTGVLSTSMPWFADCGIRQVHLR